MWVSLIFCWFVLSQLFAPAHPQGLRSGERTSGRERESSNFVAWETRTLTAIDFLYRSYHRGAMCNSPSHMYVIEPGPLNTCYPPDPFSKLPHKHTCTAPGNLPNYQYLLVRNEYPATDTTCSQNPILPKQNQEVKKDHVCKKDIDTGAYLMARCGKLDRALKVDQLILKSYSNFQCTHGRSLYGTGVVKAMLLNQCGPVYNPPSSGEGNRKDEVAYHRILTRQPQSTTSPNLIVITEDRYRAQDPHCQQAPISTSNVVYDSTVKADGTNTCKSDPLQRDMAYTYVTALTSDALETFRPPQWILYP